MNCQRCASAIENGDLRCAVCAETVPFEQTEHTETVLEVLRCDGCGAALAYDAKAQAPRCGFCSSTMRLEAITDPMEQTQAYLPLLVERKQASNSLRKWLGKRGFFCPSDLLAAAKLESLKPLWWTGWVFDADAKMSWTADSNADAGRADWAPHAGQISMRFSKILVSASRGLDAEEVQTLAHAYELDSAQTEIPNEAGALIEQFDVQRSSAREQILAAIHQIAEARITESEIPGSRFRNVNIEACLEALQTTRLAFPAYVLAYRYRDKLYRAVVHGQDPDIVLGKAPISWLKVIIVIGSIFAALMILGVVLTKAGI